MVSSIFFFCRRYALVDFGLAQKVPTAPHVNNPQSCQTDQSSSVPAPPENELKAQESKQQVIALYIMNVSVSDCYKSEFVTVLSFFLMYSLSVGK